MILKMEKLILYALSEDKKAVLERLMGLKCLHLIPPEEAQNFEDLKSLASRDVPKVYEYESQLSEVSSALSALLEYEPKPGLFTQKAAISLESVLNLDTIDAALKTAASVKGILQNISEVRSFQSADQFLRQSLLPWRNLDLALDKLSTRQTGVQLFTLPAEADMEAIRREAAEIPCLVEEVSSDSELHYLAAVSLNADRETAAQFFKERGGLMLQPFSLTGTPGENIAALERKEAEYEKDLKALKDSLAAQAKDTVALKEAYDQLSTAIYTERARQNLMLTDQSFFVSGWLAQKDRKKVEKALEGFSCCYEFVPPAEDENPPIRFKNNVLVEPFEIITEMYGLPSPASLDPDPFIAPFFFLFFGMMLSDAGYGLLLLIGGFLAARMTRKGTFSNKMFRLISLCGISTIIWGAIYGSWFGDVITVAAETFFHKEIAIPMMINPLEEPMTIMIISFLFGAVHLFVGMGLKAYLLIKRGHPWSALFDIGFWYLVLIGLGLMLLGGMALEIGKWMAIVGAVGLVCTQGREKPSFIGKIISGVLSLYDITSYFSDILSYSRILALGLATGVIASVINILATLPGANLIGVVLFVLIFVFGHLLNLAINALGSYVHTSRLQYVEFFGKFYESGGKPFTPFAPQTKYNIVDTKEEF